MYTETFTKTVEKECKDNLAPDCASDRKMFFYGAMGVAALILVATLLKMIFGFPKLLFNFRSMEILGKPARRFFMFVVPFVFSVLQIVLLGSFLLTFIVYMTSGGNINVAAGRKPSLTQPNSTCPRSARLSSPGTPTTDPSPSSTSGFFSCPS
jgi:hypothetical protein